MNDQAVTIPAELAGLAGHEWLDRLEDLAEDLGYFEPLGPDHQAVHIKGSDKIVVTFETAQNICSLPAAEPCSFDLARKNGWSVLSIISNENSWFRHPAIYQFFDKLIDEGFFDAYEKVLFHGVSGGGYAACAYSVAAPGSTVLAIRPQATLDPKIAGWDKRFLDQRRLDFTSRYGYAPDMIDGAEQVYIVYSPTQKIDAIHAALFTRPNVTKLRVPGIVGPLEDAFFKARIYNGLIITAMNGTMNKRRFALTMRSLKATDKYRKNLVARAMASGHPTLAANAAAFAGRTSDDPFFAQALALMAQEDIHPSTNATPKTLNKAAL